MGVNFCNDPTKQGFFAPLRFEATIRDCEVEGEIPSEINGTFYRCGIDRQYPARFQGDALFNEDGFVDMFRFGNGHVDFRSRYVRTERFLAERKARRALFGLYRNRLTNDPSVKDVSLNTANTNVIFHGGRLMALKEDSPPTEMDPDTLETKGPWRFDGKLDSLTFTAHPKIDGVTGEMIAFGYEAKGDLTDDVALYWIDKSGRVTREIWFKAPVVGMMHDMAITEDHIVIPIASYSTSRERLEAGKVHWAWNPKQPIYVAVLPRDGDAKDVRWFKGPAGRLHPHAERPQRGRQGASRRADLPGQSVPLDRELGRLALRSVEGPLHPAALDLRSEFKERYLGRVDPVPGFRQRQRPHPHGRPLRLARLPLQLPRHPRHLAAVRRSARR